MECAATKRCALSAGLPLVFAASLLAGCATKPPLEAVSAPEVEAPFLVARYKPDYYSQTPAWTLQVAKDGRAELQLRTSKKARWYRLHKLSADQVTGLKQRIAEARFFDLPAEMVAHEDHVPDQVLEIRLDSDEHQVRVWGACALQDRPEVGSFLSIWAMLADFFPSLERNESQYFDLLCREPAS